eukprot:2803782-Prymnesium_polylepis.1
MGVWWPDWPRSSHGTGTPSRVMRGPSRPRPPARARVWRAAARSSARRVWRGRRRAQVVGCECGWSDCGCEHCSVSGFVHIAALMTKNYVGGARVCSSRLCKTVYRVVREVLT